MREPAVDNDESGRPDVTPDSVAALLDAWVRSELAFRGHRVEQLHTAHDGTGIDRVRYLILREIFYGGPGRLSYIAERVSLTPSHASRVVDSLVRRRLIERTVPDGDRRVKMLSLSPDGRDLMGRIDAQGRELLAERLTCAGFSSREATEFSGYFQRFAAETERWSTSLPATADG